MSKLWQGRSDGQLDIIMEELNASINVDKRLYKEDIQGSIAHVIMLGAAGILSETDSQEIAKELKNILNDIDAKTLIIDTTCEDIHTFIEQELTRRLPLLGKKLHTGRSRNDQVATDTKLYIKKEIDAIKLLIGKLLVAIATISQDNISTIMPGYTHLQRAQPITFAHHLMAYFNMFQRDYDRLADCYDRLNISPLGSAALAGTGYPIDRSLTAKLLGFNGYTDNSIDGVSDRDYCIELASCISIIMMHLSRLSEEIILWSSWEFQFIELSDTFSTGSSIMPQKKNPDIAELVRGKSGRVYGNLMALLTIMKSLPLAYNKDMQEDKECIFDSIDTVKKCLEVFAPMLSTITVNSKNMRQAASKGFINATDCADYLVEKGLAFRTAYGIVGQLVAYCTKNSLVLEDLSLSVYKEFSQLFENDIYDAIDLKNCVQKRNSDGGTGMASVQKQLDKAQEWLKDNDFLI